MTDTQSGLTNTTSLSNSAGYIGALISFLFGNTTQSSNGNITPTISPTINPDNYPTITLPPIITNAPTQNISLIIALVQNINTYCQGRLDQNNISCLDKFSVHPNAKFYLVNSVIAFRVEQCADFVKALEAMTNGVLIGTIDNAIRFFTDLKPPQYERHYRSEGNIQVGDIAFWDYDTYGHTGKVVSVDLTGKTFQVAEANWDGKLVNGVWVGLGGIRIGTKSLNSPNLMGWLRLKK